MMPQLADKLVHELYELAGRSMEEYIRTGDDDFSISISGLARFRIMPIISGALCRRRSV